MNNFKIIHGFRTWDNEHFFDLVDENEERIVSVCAEINDNKILLYEFGFVNDEQRKKYIKKGCASFLMKNVINELREKHKNKILFLTAFSDKEEDEDLKLSQKELIKFYRKQGFKRVSPLVKYKEKKHIKGYYSSKKECILDWAKRKSAEMEMVL